MKGIVVELYKDITKSSSAPINDENYYKVLGHFDHFCCRCTNSISKFSTYEPSLKAGHDSQIMYLFNYENNNESINSDTDFSYYKSDLPIRVLTLIQTKNNNTDDCIKLDDKINKMQKLLDDIVAEISSRDKESKISAEIYYTLGCTDLAVLMDTNRLTLVPELLGKLSKAISHSSSLYSVIGFSNDINNMDLENVIYTNNELELSLRLTLKQNGNDGVKKLEEQLKYIKNNKISYTITRLLGNYDLLILIDSGACYVLAEIIKKDGLFNVENSDSVFGVDFERVRPTLRFKKYDDLLQVVKKDKIIEISDTTDKHIIEELRTNATEFFDKSKKYENSNLKNFSTSLKPQLEQLIIFCSCIRENYTKNVNPEFWEILKPSIKLFSEILEKHNMLTFDNEQTYDNSLKSISYFVSTLSEYLSNLLHLHRYFLEERGIFDYNISSNTKLLIAYNQFANIIKEMLLSAEYQENEAKREIAIYVTSKLGSKNLSSKLFNHLEQYDINDSLININIPTSCLFNIKENLASIIHEVAHFVGPRNRRKRAAALIKSVCKVIATKLFSTFYYISFIDTSMNEETCSDIRKDIDSFYASVNLEKFNIEYLEKVANVLYSSLINSFNINAVNERELFLTNLKSRLMKETINLLLLKNNQKTNYIFDQISEIQRIYDNNVWRMFNSWVKDNIENLSPENTNRFYNWLSYYYPTDIRNFGKKEDAINNAFLISTSKQNRLNITSIENTINSIFSGTSEAFCDLMMINTLNLSIDDYYDVIHNLTGLHFSKSRINMASKIRLLLVMNNIVLSNSEKFANFFEDISWSVSDYKWTFAELFEYFSSKVEEIKMFDQNRIISLMESINQKDSLLEALYEFSYVVDKEE